MSTNLVRVPFAWPIGTRSGSSLTKDPYIQNGVLEKYGDKFFVSKRPGTASFRASPATGTSQGAFFFNSIYYTIVNDVLYQSGTSNFGSDAKVWFNAPATWFGRQDFGAVVFKGRMFVIGGATPTNQSDIWQSADGLAWSVNSGGQPWGARASMGAVVLNNQIFVVGGYNLTLGTAFSDIWSTPDGLNWKQIQAAPPWAKRFGHCCVAANNGIYVYGGQNELGTYYNDVWFSADGVDWAELTAAAPWSARARAGGLFFNNKLWIIAGNASGSDQNDVWSSPDGVNWTRTTAAAFSASRDDMACCVYAGKMWSIGGQVGSPTTTTTQIYSSSNGVTWTLTTQTTPLASVGGAQVLVFNVPSFQAPVMCVLGGHLGAAAPNSNVYISQNNVPVAASYALTPTFSGQQYQFTTYLDGNAVVFKNQCNLYVLSAGTLTKVTDPNYPPTTVVGIVVLNAFIYVMNSIGEIYSCQLEDPTTWPALQFLTADYENDPGVAVAKYLNYVVAFGTYTTQFFYDNGANQPTGTVLAPMQNANLRVGCVAAPTVTTCGNGLFWVGQGDQGGRSVYTFNGFRPQPVSTPYIDRILMATTATSLIGIGACCDGREFYILKTGASTALVYDISYKEWYEWDTLPYNNYISDFTVGGDYLLANTNGVLVKLSPTAYTDVQSGNFTFKMQTDKEDHGNTARKFFGSAVLMGDSAASSPSIAASDDDYQTTTTFGTVSMSDNRPRLTRLGSARRRSWIVSQTDNVAARFEALEVEYSQGES